ncbi:alpha/beta hydrolase [Streptomyces sp. NPDC051987]|uniref:alpha/beta hydrolase n=1 Tax=Streptomyces sp. NPDC051987 TaxID=3155808 RepID=UPI003442D22B
MKPRLLFVHGVGGPRNPAAELDLWLRALAEGGRHAGHARRFLDLTRGWAADARFVYYGHLFGRPQEQGQDSGPPDDPENCDEAEAELVRDLFREALAAWLAESTDEQEAAPLRHAQAQLDPEGGAQGAGAVVRQVLDCANTLLSAPGLRTVGTWTSAGLMVGQLRQVTRYLRRAERDRAGTTLDTRVRRCLDQELDPGVPTIVLAHSLGTVVALEALHTHDVEVPLFVTLGSPLGMRAVVGRRVRPQPLRVPEAVGRWLNFWDKDDFIAVRPRLEKTLLPNRQGVLPCSRPVASAGAWVHPAVKYLAQPGVAGPVIEAIERATAP